MINFDFQSFSYFLNAILISILIDQNTTINHFLPKNKWVLLSSLFIIFVILFYVMWYFEFFLSSQQQVMIFIALGQFLKVFKNKYEQQTIKLK